MGVSTTFLALLLGGHASATYLYVSSYSGFVTTLNLTGTALETVAATDACGTSPSWLTLDPTDGVLYCADEGFGTWPDGTIVSLATNDDGTLGPLDAQTTLVGGVSTQIYGSEGNGLAVAYYAGSGFATWDITDPSSISLVNLEELELAEPGPIPDRQDAAHPHQALLDPTGGFILVPDLGADLVRIYSVSEAGLDLTAAEPLSVPAGSGPRHGAFAVHEETTYYYLVTELGNTILGYRVEYGDGTMTFEQVYESSTHGEGNEAPASASAAEILVSADQNFLIVSSRNELAFEIPNFDPDNSTALASDTLINFSIDGATGALTQLQTVPAGGRTPRQFSLSSAGDVVAVGLQDDGRVVLLERDASTGLLGDFVASVDVEGQVTSVIFNESG